MFGSRLDKARHAFSDTVVQAGRILLVGEGNGRFLTSLLGQKGDGCVKVVEKSTVMVRLAKDRIRKLEDMRCDVEFIETDLHRCQPGEGFDCVVTHFFLDLFNPPGQTAIIEKFAELTTENATWINVDFIPARTLRGRLLIWLAYRFFRMISRIEAKSCSDESPVATQSGWILAEAIPYLGGLVVARRYRKMPA